jgi:hypothetical protein
MTLPNSNLRISLAFLLKLVFGIHYSVIHAKFFEFLLNLVVRINYFVSRICTVYFGFMLNLVIRINNFMIRICAEYIGFLLNLVVGINYFLIFLCASILDSC